MGADTRRQRGHIHHGVEASCLAWFHAGQRQEAVSLLVPLFQESPLSPPSMGAGVPGTPFYSAPVCGPVPLVLSLLCAEISSFLFPSANPRSVK